VRLSGAEAGEIDGVVGALKEDAQNLVFPAEPLLSITDDFYVLSDSQQAYTGLESLKGLAIGIISDYSYSTPVTALLVENARTPGAVRP
jgi:polar amino acid transport system substrate-binding protein